MPYPISFPFAGDWKQESFVSFYLGFCKIMCQFSSSCGLFLLFYSFSIIINVFNCFIFLVNFILTINLQNVTGKIIFLSEIETSSGECDASDNNAKGASSLKFCEQEMEQWGRSQQHVVASCECSYCSSLQISFHIWGKWGKNLRV